MPASPWGRIWGWTVMELIFLLSSQGEWHAVGLTWMQEASWYDPHWFPQVLHPALIPQLSIISCLLIIILGFLLEAVVSEIPILSRVSSNSHSVERSLTKMAYIGMLMVLAGTNHHSFIPLSTAVAITTLQICFSGVFCSLDHIYSLNLKVSRNFLL